MFTVRVKIKLYLKSKKKVIEAQDMIILHNQENLDPIIDEYKKTLEDFGYVILYVVLEPFVQEVQDGQTQTQKN